MRTAPDTGAPDDVPGLYLLGLSWQHTRGSALLGVVVKPAGFIAAQIAARTEVAAQAPDIERDGARPEPAGVGKD